MASATRDARWRRRRVDGARAREVSLFNVFFIYCYCILVYVSKILVFFS